MFGFEIKPKLIGSSLEIVYRLIKCFGMCLQTIALNNLIGGQVGSQLFGCHANRAPSFFFLLRVILIGIDYNKFYFIKMILTR